MRRAICTLSAPVVPPAIQSVAETRTDIGLCCGHTARTARNKFERKAQTIGERSTVLVAALIGDRRQKAGEQVAVRHVQLEQVESCVVGHDGRVAELLNELIQVVARCVARHLIHACLIRQSPRQTRAASWARCLVRRAASPFGASRPASIPCDPNGRFASRSWRPCDDARNRQGASTLRHARSHTTRCSPA